MVRGGRISELRARLSGERGFTLVETLVACVLLVVGVLGIFLILDTANVANGKTRAREAATNLTREVLEDARDTPYAQIDKRTWIESTLKDLPGGSGTTRPEGANGIGTTVTSRGTTFNLVVRWCTFDDGRDGYGPHGSGIAWCADSAGSGTADSQPEDLKRVSVAASYAVEGRAQPTLVHTATFGSGGVTVGPSMPTLAITAPPVADPANPVITSNPADGLARFKATSVGAADMRFSIDGIEQTTGITENGDGSWSLDWNVVPMKDGVYTIGATPVDVLGTRGSQALLQVKLARGAPTPATNVIGGYNDLYRRDVKTRVVELEWSASPDGTVSGYEVAKGGTTVCGSSLATSCIDFEPAASGSTTYTIRTLYTTAGGTTAWVTTDHTVTAPSGGGGGSAATKYGVVGSSSFAGTTGCASSGFSTATKRDLVPSYPTSGGTSASTGTRIVGCIAPFSSGAALGAGTATFTAWFANTGNRSCDNNYWLYHDGNLLAGPTVYGNAPRITVPGGTTTPTRFTVTFDVPARTLASGDDLELYWPGRSATGACSAMTLYYGSGTHQTTLELPTLGGGGGSGSGGGLERPAPPTDLTVTVNGDGTRTLSWTASSGTPAPEFYRVYRDGLNYTNRVDTAGTTGPHVSGTTVIWTDTSPGGASRSYRVTAASPALAESDFAGPVSG